MTDPTSDDRPSHGEATAIIANNDALQAAGSVESADTSANADAATDDDARTADTAPVGDVKND